MASLHFHLHAGRQPVRGFRPVPDHARAGAGLEYRRNFLKLVSIVTCVCLDGKTLRTEDYQERPANGWDVRGRPRVPSRCRSWAASSRMSSTMAKKSPCSGWTVARGTSHANTVGINYTPVPLITPGRNSVRASQGKAHPADVEYELTPGVPRLCDPTAVAAMRSPAGSQYDP
ncbi:inverse autotransporter beta domain-containing protein [Salmonella enterica subsp. enterica]|nr:inverse autotransporter beta domain-containing protein [Salmonella enterica subsp. enterica]